MYFNKWWIDYINLVRIERRFRPDTRYSDVVAFAIGYKIFSASCKQTIINSQSCKLYFPPTKVIKCKIFALEIFFSTFQRNGFKYSHLKYFLKATRTSGENIIAFVLCAATRKCARARPFIDVYTLRTLRKLLRTQIKMKSLRNVHSFSLNNGCAIFLSLCGFYLLFCKNDRRR